MPIIIGFLNPTIRPY